jgi:SAM-dependent methyltransferase
MGKGVVHDNCPSCGSSELNDFFQQNVIDPITEEKFHILSCKSCGVAFTSPFPSNMELYYPSQYRGYGPLVTWVLQTFYKYHISKWNQLFDSPGTALEIGCGAGFMLAPLSRMGWHVKGLERTEAMAAHAREKLGLDVTSEDLSDLPAEQTYDLIIIFNVLEHLDDPYTTLKTSAKHLNPGGKIVISVPNFCSFQARFAGPYWLHLDPPRHLFHFTPESLEVILSHAGLKSQSTSYISFEHDPYGWIESIINKLTGHQNSITLFLMGLKPFGFRVFLSSLAAILLAVPALIMSAIGWMTKTGAIFQTVAVKKTSS